MAVSVTIDVRRVERLLSAVGGPGERLLRRRMARIEARARELASVHGSMAEGIESEVVGLRAVLRSTNPHTQLVVHGSRPHEIRPRRARALRFTQGGRVVYRKRVFHPGYAGDDFLTRAVREAGR